MSSGDVNTALSSLLHAGGDLLLFLVGFSLGNVHLGLSCCVLVLIGFYHILKIVSHFNGKKKNDNEKHL